MVSKKELKTEERSSFRIFPNNFLAINKTPKGKHGCWTQPDCMTSQGLASLCFIHSFVNQEKWFRLVASTSPLFLPNTFFPQRMILIGRL